MARIHDAVTRYLSRREWSFDDRSDHLICTIAGKHGSWLTYFTFDEDKGYLLVHSVVPVEIPESRRREVALYLTRANYGLPIGNFEMDLDNGEVRCKTSVDADGVELGEPLIDHLLLANIVSVDRYLEGLRSVVGGADPADSVRKAEERPSVG